MGSPEVLLAVHSMPPSFYLTLCLHIVNIRRDAANGADDGVHIGGRDLGIQEFLCQRPQQRQQNAGYHHEQRDLQPHRRAQCGAQQRDQRDQRSQRKPYGNQMDRAGRLGDQEHHQQHQPEKSSRFHIIISFP